MNKFFTITLVALVGIVLVGCGKQPNVVTQPAPVAEKEAPKLASTNYVPYSATAADKALAEGKDVAVFFHSKTCGSCAKLDANINENLAQIPNDVVILKADWDENQSLADELKVEKYHTVSYLWTNQNVKGLFTLDDIVKNFDDVPTAAAPAPKLAAVGYAAYDEKVFDEAIAEGKEVAVFFHSKTCGSCAKLDANINDNISQIPGDVVVLKADWDENQDLAAELDVAKYHTVTFFGDAAKKNVKGLFTLEDLLGNIGS